jgi:hypothetical protein
MAHMGSISCGSGLVRTSRNPTPSILSRERVLAATSAAARDLSWIICLLGADSGAILACQFTLLTDC